MNTILEPTKSTEDSVAVPVIDNELKPENNTDPHAISTNVSGVKVLNNKFLPYIAKDQIAIIDPDLPTLGRNCLVCLNNQYLFMKHKMLDREYLQSLDNSENSFPITSKLDYQILGVVTRIILESREG